MASAQSPDRSVIDRLAQYMVEARDARLPPEVAKKAKHHILDTIAAMVSGAQLGPGQLAIKYIQAQGGTPEAQVAGCSLVTTAVNAALANGIMAHADETDDSHAPSGTHPGCAIVPAALAMAEKADRDGQAFLNAVVLGYDIGCRSIRALGYRNPLEQRDFSSHSIGGLYGAAAAAGALTNISPTQIRYLISYTAQQASGIPSWASDPDHIEKAFDFAGMPARNGVTATTLVESGFTGVWDVFDGDRNFFRSFSQSPNPEEMLDGLGSRYEVMLTNIKKYCVGSPIQAAVEALLNIMEEHHVAPADIEHMEVTLPVGGARIVNDREMPDINLQHIMAITLLDRELSFSSAHDYRRMKAAQVLELRRRIELKGDDALVTPESQRQAIVEITTKTGQRFRDHVVKVRGTAENPMTTQEVEDKARELLAPSLGVLKADALISTIRDLESLDSVRVLRPLLQP